MQVYTEKLKELIKKASFNHAFDSVRLIFERDTVVSNMRQPNGDFQVLINMKNDVLKNGRKKLELNFRAGKKPPKFSFETDEPQKCEIVKNRFVVYSKKNSKGLIIKDRPALYPPKYVDEYVSDNGLPETDDICFFTTVVNQEFLEEIQNWKRRARKSGKIFYTVERRRLSLEVKRGNTTYPFGFSQQISKEFNNITVSFNFNDFHRLMDILREERDKEYKLKFLYDEKKWIGSLYAVSNDRSERYILNGKREMEAATIQPLGFESRYDHTPEIPENWNYGESVEKIRKAGFKWKNLTKEIAEELWIAKQILPKSPSEAAKIRHGSMPPGITWTQFCNDIGSSPQVVNRWLKRRFETPGLNNDGNGANGTHSENLNRKSIKKVIGPKFVEPKSIDDEWKSPVFLNLSGRDASKFTGKLLQEFENKNVAEAVVNVKTQNMTKTWFKPLFDHLLCFANENNGCLIYLGSNRDKFIKEFNQHGIILAKVG